MSRAPWSQPKVPLTLPQMVGDTHADVCIVGAGIAGLSVALALLKEGHSVVVVDTGHLGMGETGRTTAHLATALDFGWANLVRVHGSRGAEVAAESHGAAIDQIERTVAEESIECGFRRVDGFLVGEDAVFGAELEAARSAGLGDVELMPATPFPNLRGAAIRYPRQAELQPILYLAGLARAVRRRGGRVFGGTRAVRVDKRAEVVMADGARVRTGSVVLATNVPFVLGGLLIPKLAAYRTYAIGRLIPRDVTEPALLWDTEDPFHYVRVHSAYLPGHDLLIVGGEDHRTGQDGARPWERFRRLTTWSHERFPFAGEVAACWSGQIQQSADGLGVIGLVRQEPDVYVVTGDSGNGMTHGTLAGRVIADLMADRPSEWAELYAISRIRLGALPTLLRENAKNVTQLTAWMTGGDDVDLGALPRGSGVVVRRRRAKVAVYRDPTGQLRELSAVCPHMYCVVGWNATEGSWDCPCHGSRFDPRGHVLNGPANTGLEPITSDDASVSHSR